MDNKQIHAILSTDKYLVANNFLGVFPLDLIPTTAAITYPCSLVVNTKPHNHPGEHWIAIAKNQYNETVFFDSYGSPPFNLPEVGVVLSDDWTYNNTTLQSTFTTVCGEYCIFFLLHYTRGYTLDQIVHLLNDIGDKAANDAMIYHYIRDRYPSQELKQLKPVDFPFVFNQIASSLSKY
jgi:hypothetical protein